MNIYIVIYLIIIIGGYLAYLTNTQQAKKVYVSVCILLFLLLNSLRSLTIGADTMNYYNMFLSTITISWEEIWKLFIGRYFYGTSEEDIGYVVFVKLISYLTHDYHVFTFIAESLFFIPLGILLYRYSKNCIQLVFAFTLYGALLNAIPITNCRQTYAFGLCIITVIMYIEKYKWKYIAFFIVIAATIHLSAILFVLPYILILFHGKLKLFHIMALVMVPLVVLDPNSLIRFMGSLTDREQYVEYGEQKMVGGTENFVVMLELLSVYILYSFRNYNFKRANNENLILYSMAPLFTLFGPLIMSNGTMIRISMYFHIFLILLIPNATDLFSSKNVVTINILMALLLVLLSYKTGDYYFFWEIDNPSTW